MILATDEDTKVKDAVALRFKELCLSLIHI